MAKVNYTVLFIFFIVLILVIFIVWYRFFGPGKKIGTNCQGQTQCPSTLYCNSLSVCDFGAGRQQGESCRRTEDCVYGTICYQDVCIR